MTEVFKDHANNEVCKPIIFHMLEKSKKISDSNSISFYPCSGNGSKTIEMDEYICVFTMNLL